MSENVTFVYNDGTKRKLSIKAAVIAEAKCEGQIEGGRPDFEETKKKSKKQDDEK